MPREMIAAGLVTEADVANSRKRRSSRRDEIWTEAAVHILKKHKPNLLMFHLLATDSNQHRYGARSLGGNTAIGLADARVKRSSMPRGRRDDFVVSDQASRHTTK